MRRFARVAFVFGLGVAGGCQDLPTIETGVCGNGFIEPREYCDAIPRNDCIKPNLPGECHYKCSGGVETCPAGMGAWVCGSDGACRQARGKFEKLGEPLAADVLRLAIADFDGDGRGDIVTAGGSEMRVHYYDEALALAKTTSIPAANANLAIGQLTTDELSDIILNAGFGLDVLRGRPNRSFAPTVSPRVEETFDDVRIVALNADGKFGDELLGLSATKVMRLMEDGKLVELFTINSDLHTSENKNSPDGGIVAGQIFEGSSCDELVLAYKGSSKVAVYTPCTSDPKDPWNTGGTPVVIDLPAGSTVEHGVHLVKANNDDIPDIAVGVVDAEGYHIAVAYGAEDGKFSSDPALSLIGLNKASLYARVHSTKPEPGVDSDLCQMTEGVVHAALALGDINGDCVLDYADSCEIRISDRKVDPAAEDPCLNLPKPPFNKYFTTVRNNGAPWVEAVIDDLNSNGITDIAVSSKDTSGVTLFSGTNLGIFHPFEVPTLLPPTNLTVGDFDGDFINDLAFSESGTTGDFLSIAFGQFLGGPEAPVRIGQVEVNKTTDEINQIIAANYINLSLDLMSDLNVLSSTAGTDGKQTYHLSVFPGNTSRLLQSPFLFLRQTTSSTSSAPNIPLHVAIGRFTPAEESDSVAPEVAVLAIEVPTGSLMTPDSDPPDTGPGGPSFAVRLWMVRSTGEAEFQLVDLDGDTAAEQGIVVGSGAFGKPAGAAAALIGAVDLNNDGLDELIGFTSDPGTGKGEMFITNRSEKKWAVEAVKTTDLFSMNGQMSIVDADGDRLTAEKNNAVENGHKDVLLLTDDQDGDRQLVAFWNTGSLDLSVSTRLTGEALKLAEDDKAPEITGFAPLNADTDTQLEVAVVTDKRTYLVQIKDREFVDPVPILISTETTSEVAPGGVAIAAGDVTGDGVPDLAIADLGIVYVIKGQPVIPGEQQ